MFHSALDKAPQHVVAQCGLGTALLGRARECISTGAFAWAATLLEVLSRTFFPSKAVSPAVCVSCECHLDWWNSLDESAFFLTLSSNLCVWNSRKHLKLSPTAPQAMAELLQLGSCWVTLRYFHQCLALMLDGLCRNKICSRGIVSNLGEFSFVGPGFVLTTSKVHYWAVCSNGDPLMCDLAMVTQVTYAQILPCEVIEAGVEAVGMGDVSATVTAYAHKRIKAWCQQRVAAAKRAMRAYLHLLHLCPDQGSVFADCAIAMELVSSLQRDKTASSPAW